MVNSMMSPTITIHSPGPVEPVDIGVPLRNVAQ
jgi:hypothetical protein